MSKITNTKLGGARVSPLLSASIKRSDNTKKPMIEKLLGKKS